MPPPQGSLSADLICPGSAKISSGQNNHAHFLKLEQLTSMKSKSESSSHTSPALTKVHSKKQQGLQPPMPDI
jgi:hypothetical protein